MALYQWAVSMGESLQNFGEVSCAQMGSWDVVKPASLNNTQIHNLFGDQSFMTGEI